LRAKVRDLQIGGRKMHEIVEDNRKALAMLEAESVDLANRIGVENIARTTAIGADVNAVKNKVASLQKNLQSYQDEMFDRVGKVEVALGVLAQNTEVANVKLDALKQQVAVNTMAIQSLAAVSYSGWSMAQKAAGG
jgi:hypothetical protein